MRRRPRGLAVMNVLIVDDDPFAGMVLGELVRDALPNGEGEIAICETLEECHEKCSEGCRYDVVCTHHERRARACPREIHANPTPIPCAQAFLDWELDEDVTGLDVVRQVRPLQQNAKIIIVSGNERSFLEPAVDEELTSLGVDADAWWVKPALANAIEALLEQHKPAG